MSPTNEQFRPTLKQVDILLANLDSPVSDLDTLKNYIDRLTDAPFDGLADFYRHTASYSKDTKDVASLKSALDSLGVMGIALEGLKKQIDAIAAQDPSTAGLRELRMLHSARKLMLNSYLAEINRVATVKRDNLRAAAAATTPSRVVPPASPPPRPTPPASPPPPSRLVSPGAPPPPGRPPGAPPPPGSTPPIPGGPERARQNRFEAWKNLIRQFPSSRDVVRARRLSPADIRTYRAAMNTMFVELDRDSLLVKGANPEINHQIEAIINQQARFDLILLDLEKPDLKPVNELEYEELIREMMKEKIDQVKSDFASKLDVGRKAELLSAYLSRMRECMNPELFPDIAERIRLDALRTQYALERMTGTIESGKGEAAISRQNLFKKDGPLYNYTIKREDILRVMYNPVWGNQLQLMLQRALDVGANENYVLRRSGVVFKYEQLSGENGGQVLSEFIEQEFPTAAPEAKKFTYLLFITFDLLTMLLEERQKRAEGTRLHNKTDELETIAATNPVAAYAHAGFRYSDKADWRGHALGLVSRINGHGYGKVAGAGLNEAEAVKSQELAYGYLDCFVDFKKVFEPMLAPAKGRFQTYFPSALEILQLKDNEVLDMLSDTRPDSERPPALRGAPGFYIDANGRRTATPPSNNLTSWEDIDGSMTAWISILQIFFTSVPEHMTEAEILQGKGKDPGILTKLTKLMGVAKGFRPRHLEELGKPLLLAYCLELITFANVSQGKKQQLIKEIQHSLVNSPGIEKFIPSILRPVALALGDGSVGLGWKGRLKQAKAYVAKYCEFYGLKLPSERQMQFTNVEKGLRALWEANECRIVAPRPFRSVGSMESEKKTTH